MPNSPQSTSQSPNFSFTFFGSSRLSVIVLDEMEKLGYIPACIVTTPDKPKGRKLIVTPNDVKLWGQKRNIRVYDPAKLSESTFIEALRKENTHVFIVASFGKIIPKAVSDIPPRTTLNIHPSLLPIYRGPSPLPTVMLDDTKDTGITIIELDEEMDHGPILAQKNIHVNEWPTYEVFEEDMARQGTQLLVEIMPKWMAGIIKAIPQDHNKATYTKKITKEEALINLQADPYTNFRKIQAYHEWPQAYFFVQRGEQSVRVKITQASFEDGKLIIEKVIPEGKREMRYEDFRNSTNTSPSPKATSL